MCEKPGPGAQVREIRRRPRHRYSAEEKIRIVLEGLKGEESIAELCRREGSSPNLYIRLEQGVLGGREEAMKRPIGPAVNSVYLRISQIRPSTEGCSGGHSRVRRLRTHLCWEHH